MTSYFNGTNNAQITAYPNKDDNTCRKLTMFDSTGRSDMATALLFSNVLSGTTTSYLVYGTHNVTVSTAAPTTTLGNGVMHMVYDA